MCWPDSKMVPNAPCPWCSYPCIIPAHTVPGSVCMTNITWQKGWYTAFEIRLQKTAVPALVPLALVEAPTGQGTDICQLPVTEFGSRSQFPSRLSPSRELDRRLLRYPDPEPSKSAAPEFQNVRNCVRKQVGCFQLLSFVVICYTAINNSYTYFHK